MTDRQPEPSSRSPWQRPPQQRDRTGFSVKRVWPRYADGAGAGRQSNVVWGKSAPAGTRYRVVSG